VVRPAGPDALIAGAGISSRPRRIIDRSEKIARAEDLRCALTVLMIGDTASVSVEGLVAELARRHDLPAGSMQPHRMAHNELLLILPSEAKAVRIFNGRRPINLPLNLGDFAPGQQDNNFAEWWRKMLKHVRKEFKKGVLLSS
jgi:hypothetical protein